MWTAYGERMTTNYVELTPRAMRPVDRHDNEQINYVLPGRVEVRLGDTRILAAGPRRDRAIEVGRVVVRLASDRRSRNFGIDTVSIRA